MSGNIHWRQIYRILLDPESWTYNMAWRCFIKGTTCGFWTAIYRFFMTTQPLSHLCGMNDGINIWVTNGTPSYPNLMRSILCWIEQTDITSLTKSYRVNRASVLAYRLLLHPKPRHVHQTESGVRLSVSAVNGTGVAGRVWKVFGPARGTEKERLDELVRTMTFLPLDS